MLDPPLVPEAFEVEITELVAKMDALAKRIDDSRPSSKSIVHRFACNLHWTTMQYRRRLAAEGREKWLRRIAAQPDGAE